MSNWKTIPNPAWKDIKPQHLTGSECHDHSHFITIQCDNCGDQGHLHESSIASLPDVDRVATRCKACNDILIFRPDELHGMFQTMREQGWID